jgi:hypothetical protein
MILSNEILLFLTDRKENEGLWKNVCRKEEEILLLQEEREES